MSRISTTKLATLLLLGLASTTVWGSTEESRSTAVPPLRGTLSEKPATTHPIKQIFSHAGHEKAFDKLGVQCTDCHDFSVKPVEPGPLANVVPAGMLRPQRDICHQCHLGRISLPTPNQCTVCHPSTASTKPLDHTLNWQQRHGRFAQFHREACTQCHTQQSCNTCHARLDRMNPVVHPGSFRLFHSVRARMNPQSCTECHKSRSFCIDCHSGRRAQ